MSKAILFILLIFLISFISAQELDLSIVEHYYKDSNPVLVYDNNSFDGISFEIIGKNNLQTERIMSLRILNSSPLQFTEAIPKTEVDFIRILQERVLFVSSIIPASSFPNNYTNFTIEITGISEKNQSIITSETSKTIFIQNEPEGFFYDVGKILFPSHPIFGIGFLLSFGCLILYFLYELEIGKKINGFKRRRMQKRYKKQQMEEKFRRMRGW